MGSKIAYWDTNFIARANNAGGTQLLDIYKKMAEADGYKVVITDVVDAEIGQRKSLKKIVGNWIEKNNITMQSTVEYPKYKEYKEAVQNNLIKNKELLNGYTATNAGERSIIEAALKIKNADHEIRIFSDDTTFSNNIELKQISEAKNKELGLPDNSKKQMIITPDDARNNSHVLRESLEKGHISADDYNATKNNLLNKGNAVGNEWLQEGFKNDEKILAQRSADIKHAIDDKVHTKNVGNDVNVVVDKPPVQDGKIVGESGKGIGRAITNDTTHIKNTEHIIMSDDVVRPKTATSSDLHNSELLHEPSGKPHKPAGAKTKLFLKGAGVAGIAITAYEWYHEGDKLIRLHNQGNDTATLSGAKSFATEVAFTSLGAGIGVTLTSTVAGSLAGTGSGLASPTPPHPLVKAGAGVLGGLAGGYVGMKAADSVNAERISNEINTQKDHEGNQWVRDKDSKEWMRVASSENMPIHESGRIFGEWARNSETGEWSRNSHSLDPRLPDFRTEIARPDQILVASGETAQLLNYKATTTSYELGMAGLPRPTDPYSIKESNDPPLHLSGKFFSNWTKNLETGEWSRNSSDLDPYFPNPQTEIASPEKTIELEARSQNIIYENALNSPEVLALRYQSIYQNEGWEALGEIPQSLQIKANPDMLVASDGDTYTLKDNQQWVSEGNFWNSDASPKITQELNSTQGVLNEVLEANKTLVQSLNSPEVKSEEVEEKPAELTSNPLINNLLAQDYTKDPEAFMAACIKLAQTPEAQALVQQSIEQAQREQVNQQDMSKTQEHEQPQKSQKIGF